MGVKIVVSIAANRTDELRNEQKRTPSEACARGRRCGERATLSSRAIQQPGQWGIVGR